MKSTLKIESQAEGIRLTLIKEAANGTTRDMVAIFGRGNLQARLLLGAVVAMGASGMGFDFITLDLSRADAITLNRVGGWMQDPEPQVADIIKAVSDRIEQGD